MNTPRLSYPRAPQIAANPNDAEHYIKLQGEEIERLRDALHRSHKELLQYAWYEQGLTGLRARNEKALGDQQGQDTKP